jgi:hypothetical protein
MTKLSYIALSQIVGGLLVIVGALHSPTLTETSADVQIYIAPLVFGAVCILAGAMLLLREPIGLYLSLLVQGLQVLSLGAPFRFLFLAGLKVAVQLTSHGLQGAAAGGGEYAVTSEPFDAAISGLGIVVRAQLGFNWTLEGNPSWSLQVNLVAVSLAWYLITHADSIVASWHPDPSSRPNSAV